MVFVRARGHVELNVAQTSKLFGFALLNTWKSLVVSKRCGLYRFTDMAEGL